MIYFFDSSALLKRYLIEKGSDAVSTLLENAQAVYVSATTQLECMSAFHRLLQSHHLDKKGFLQIQKEILVDFTFFQFIEFDESIRRISLEILGKYPLRTLDTIQLASAIHVQEEISSFVVSDQLLKKFALREGIQVIDPIE
ncbi:MAG: type II toxin-antitoxin system VapC family toxin [Cyclobacteriaceae bacterium]|nr:type II toxin-antitoxin system VapC family toxin [Cyclobacteriaceae bacterium]